MADKELILVHLIKGTAFPFNCLIGKQKAVRHIIAVTIRQWNDTQKHMKKIWVVGLISLTTGWKYFSKEFLSFGFVGTGPLSALLGRPSTETNIVIYGCNDSQIKIRKAN